MKVRISSVITFFACLFLFSAATWAQVETIGPETVVVTPASYSQVRYISAGFVWFWGGGWGRNGLLF